MSLAYTKDFMSTSTPQMILGKDGNRKELTIYNTSDTDFLYIGFGNEIDVFTVFNTLPLAPGEVYDATTPPLTAVFLLTSGSLVNTIVYYSTQSPGYVKGLLA